MTIAQMLLPEFDQEMANTRKMLDRVPDGKFAWQPDERSSTLGKIANHLVAIPVWTAVIVSGFAKKPTEADSKAQLLEVFDANVMAAREAIAGATDEQLSSEMQITRTDSRPRLTLLRERILSHSIHHRGQLSVYLRLLGVPIPGMYGPSADEDRKRD